MFSEEVLEAQATIQADLAARFVLPDGTYPFRADCPCIPDIDHPQYDPDHGKVRSWHFNHYPRPRSLCKACNGLGYIYSATLDTFCEAFRAKGWKLSILTGLGDDGDSVNLSERELGGELVRLEMVGYKEGFTGMAALEMAAWKTLEVTGG